MPNSNTNKTLIPRLIITCLFHANTNIKEGLSCHHISMTQLKGNLVELGVIKKNFNFMAPFYGWGSTASRLQPLQGGSLLFTTQVNI